MEAITDTAVIPPAAEVPERWGHPKGTWVLSGTELWDRISFHGMVAMLVLYMTGDLLQPGRMEHIIGFAAYRRLLESLFGAITPAAIATQTFGIYYAVLTFLPLIGGWLGDKFVSRRFAVTTGALTMTAGHFAMAFDQTFLIALMLLVSGAGLLRGNLKPQIRALYHAGDRRLADAFQIYSMVVNLGAFIAPLASGAVAKYYGWHAGFAVAGFGMLIGLVWYLVGARHLPPDPPKGMKVHRAPLTPHQKRDILGLFAMWPVSLGFWTAQAQIWNVYNLWLRDHVQMTVGGFAVPVPWLQALDGLAPAAYVPVVILLWRWQARRGTEPDLFTKMGVGCVIFAVSTLLLAGAPLLAGADGLAPLWIPVLFHLASNWGGAFFSPVMETFYAARAPEQWRGSLLGVDALSVSAASILSGTMGSWYETTSPPVFWLTTAAIAGAAGLYVLLLRGTMRRWLGPEEEDPAVPAG
ncbi:peptide MFS transporter [Novosphingobium flavum]|uniref:Peptide MFS transporter n=1 Tax=Novosphingobium flavum TaxID=1778672 RepID=A0A7X1FSA8_9SPHN|nr:peptide MFS transporter [Novosphingobium flavum]